MYTVFKNGVPAGNKKFTSYEAARQQARKWIRKQSSRLVDFFWTTNPMIGDYGYSVRRVKG